MRRIRSACVLLILSAILIAGCSNGSNAEETGTNRSNGLAQETKGEQLSYSGNGTVTSRRVRGDILHTWYHDQTYRLTTQNEWEPIAQDLYEMNHPVKATVDLALQRTRTDASPSFILHAGDEAVIQACDDNEWCLVQKGDQEGWFAVDGFNTIRGLNLTAEQVFEGLSFAD